MKILIIRTTPNIMNLNSYNVQEFGLAKALIKKGHSCDVAFFGGRVKDHIQMIEFDKDKALKVIWLQGFGFLYEGFFPTLHNYIDNYDIIQVGGYVGFTSCYLNRKAPDKIVNYNGLYYCKDNKGDNIKALIWDHTLLKLQRKQNMVVATKSAIATTYLKAKGIPNVTTIGVGLDLDNLERHDAEENEFINLLKNNKGINKYLLYTGVLEERRNILFLLDVFLEVLKIDNEFRLVLIGRGKKEYEDKIDKRIKDSNLEGYIYRCSKINQKHMANVYTLCNAFILPTKYEIFGMVLLEAMYYKLPVFTTYNGGSSTLMNDKNGIVLDSFSVQAWSKKIVEVINNQVLCESIGCEAHRTIASYYTWDALAGEFLKVYQKRIIER